MFQSITLILITFLLTTASWAAPEVYAPKEPGSRSVMVGEPVVNALALKDADIAQAIEVIAQKSGLNIITGQNVKGKVTVFLKNVGAREALRIVLESNGLAYAQEGGIIRVMTADEFLAKYGYAFGQDKVSRLIRLNVISPGEAQKLLEEIKSPQGKTVINEEAKTVLLVDSVDKVRAMETFLAELDVPRATATVVLRNVRADTLMPEVRRMLTQSLGAVSVDAGANALVVTDTAARLEKVRKAVEAMDARGRVMVLEAKLVHIVLNDEHPSGVDWGGILEDDQRMRLAGKYDFLAGSEGSRALSFGMIANEDFPTLIEALDTVGFVQEYPLSTIRVTGDEEVRLVARLDDPSIDMTVIPSAGKEVPDGVSLSGGIALAFNVRSAFDVTGEVSTTVVPQEARPLARDPAHAVVSGRGNTVSAHEGYTAVLGGMIVTSTVSAAHKIPLLGDLPVLGFAFRLDGTVKKEEFVIFLTPKTVSLSQMLADEGGE